MPYVSAIDPLIALGVVAATALTDAVCVMFTSSVVQRRDLAAAKWGSLTYMLSAFAVISFTNNWLYVVFAALGSWIGAYATMKVLRWRTSAAAPPAIPVPSIPTPVVPAPSIPAPAVAPAAVPP